MKDTGFTKGRKQIGRTVGVRAPAKVNLHLEVLRQRHDGFHEIETILQAVSLFDELRVTLIEQYQGIATEEFLSARKDRLEGGG